MSKKNDWITDLDKLAGLHKVADLNKFAGLHKVADLNKFSGLHKVADLNIAGLHKVADLNIAGLHKVADLNKFAGLHKVADLNKFAGLHKVADLNKFADPNTTYSSRLGDLNDLGTGLANEEAQRNRAAHSTKSDVAAEPENDAEPKIVPADEQQVSADLIREPDAATMLKPPLAAERLLSFLIAPDKLEERLGDFEEGFGFLIKHDGLGHARRWYWWQIIRAALRAGFDAALQVAKIWFGPA